MFLTNVVPIYTCLSLVKYVHNTIAVEEETFNASDEPQHDDVQRKVALVDIVFMNGMKRTCTGAIIHDNVVITAGHCFMQPQIRAPLMAPELTASFVVIGDQKKFESGYEQYLPIERVVMHPNIKEFVSDIALVHTFASMTADKIGSIIPLVNEFTTLRDDYNITILSWSRVVESQEEVEEKLVPGREAECEEGTARDLECQLIKARKTASKPTTLRPTALYLGSPYGRIPLNSDTTRQHLHVKRKLADLPTTKVLSRYLSLRGQMQNMNKDKPVQRHRFKKMNRNVNLPLQVKPDPIRTVSTIPNLNANGEPEVSLEDFKDGGYISQKADVYHPYKMLRSNDQEIKNETSKVQSNNTIAVSRSLQYGNIKYKRKSRFRHWRRQMGVKDVNKLTVEVFRILPLHACKPLIKKHLTRVKLDINEIVCYSSDQHYVTDEDSGAPAIYQGQLIAMTVYDIKGDDDNHIAIGMKLSHFCPWIAENLPVGEYTLNCWDYGKETSLPVRTNGKSLKKEKIGEKGDKDKNILRLGENENFGNDTRQLTPCTTNIRDNVKYKNPNDSVYWNRYLDT